jgi:hypothetical protein
MRILRKLRITEISAVDKPAQAHAKAVLMKRAADIDDDEDLDIVDIAKRFVEPGGDPGGVTKADFEDELRKRAAAAYPNLPFASAFSAYARNDRDGQFLMRAVLKAERAVTQAAQQLPPMKSFGPAGEELGRLARWMARSKSISHQQAFKTLYSDPSRAELVRRVREEERRATEAVRGQRAPIRNAERLYSVNSSNRGIGDQRPIRDGIVRP